MSQQSECSYEFGSFRIDAVKRLLLRDGEPVALTSKSLDTLLVLVEHRGQVVNKEELMNKLWPDTAVEENNLTQQISVLRKTLGERAGEHRYVVTVPGRGYSFVAEVRELWGNEPDLIVEQHTRSRISVDIEDESEKELLIPEETRESLSAGSHALRQSWRSKSVIVSLSVLLIGLAALVAFQLSSRNSPVERNGESKQSIAVLPFRSLNNDPADDYLGTGMTDTLIAKLSNLRQISVRPTSSVIKYAAQSLDAHSVGRELGVDLVLEGTVQRADDRIRVTVQLVDVRDRNPLWAQSFEERITAIFAVQDSISEKVAQTMLVKLNRDEQEQLRKRETENVEAYQAYLRGRFFWNKRNEDGLRKGLEHFKQAIDLDSNYGQAYAGIADAYALLGTYNANLISRDEAFQRAQEAAMKALRIDGTLAEAHTSLALIKAYYEHDESGAEREFKQAIESNPNYATAHHWYSEFLATRGQQPEAMTEILRAQELDPLSPVINTTLGERLYFARRYNEAITQLRKTLEIAPDFEAAYYALGLALEQEALYGEAIASLRKADRGTRVSPVVSASLGHTYALAGRRDAARKLLGELLAQEDPAPYEIAVIYQGLGEKQRAIDWLGRLRGRRGVVDMMLKLDPRLDALRSDPQFQGLL